MAWTGKVGEGVFGPLDEAAEVNEDCDPANEPFDEAIELTRGDEVPEEKAWPGGGRGRDGNLS